MKLAEAIKKQNRVHQRVLDMSTYALDDERVVVEGTLRDERFRPIYELSGQRSEKGVIHHMIIRLLIGGTPLRILDAEAEMPHIPVPLCLTTRESVKKVVGLKIKSGFGARVHKLIGGVQGGVRPPDPSSGRHGAGGSSRVLDPQDEKARAAAGFSGGR